MHTSHHFIPARDKCNRQNKYTENQEEKKGLSIVEVLSTCPTNWGLSPEKALEWLRSEMIPYYPLGVYKDVDTIEGGAAK